MQATAFLVFRDGDTVREGLLLADIQLNAYLFSRGALTINSSGTASITFVGFVVWESWLLLFLPKGYAFNEKGFVGESGAVARLILRVLKRYSLQGGSREPDSRRLSLSLTDPKTSGFALATWLADDFFRHGLYRRNRNKFTSTGNGPIDWARTIARRNAHVTDGNVLYLDSITRDKVSDDSYFVTRIHRSVLSLCGRRYGEMVNLDRQVVEKEGIVPLPDGDLFQLGSVHIARELRHAYADRSIRLLRVLDLFLKNRHLASQTTFEIYGTSYFEHVWEDICRTIIGTDLGIWSACIPKPKWQTKMGENVEAATLRPDILRQYRSKGLDFVLLADAKYYSLSMPPNLSGNPGVGDVVKQLVYELVIVQEAKRRGVKFAGNFFVFPVADQAGLFETVGNASFSGIAAGPIKVTLMDLSKAMALYTTGSGLSEDEISDSFGWG
jgi:hypothetical protein